MLSLHVVAGPKHHAVQHAWVRRVRALPADLRRRLDAFRFAWSDEVPEFLMPSPEGELESFSSELARVRALDAELVAFEFLRPLHDHRGDRDPAQLRDSRIRTRTLASAARLGGDPELAALLFDDPAELREQFLVLVADYWDAAFADEWSRLEPLLADAVAASGRLIARDGVYALLRTLMRSLRVDEHAEEFGLDIPHDHRVEVTAENRLTLVPSAFVWPHVRVNCDAPFPLSLVYPAPFIASEAKPRIPDGELLRLLKVLADDTRLRALRLIARAPRSTQELAPLVGITEAGLSKHLRLLADAGVVTTQREGYYVVYRLAPERLEPLTEALLRFLTD